MIILARHGQTQWNKVKRLQGWKNSPLTNLGKIQALNVAKEISKIVKQREYEMVSSPLGRALETAKIIATQLNTPEHKIQQDPLLKEYSYGIWAGMTSKEVKVRYTEQWNNRVLDKWNYVVPQGESYYLVAKRAEKWLSDSPKTKNIIAISHEMAGRVIRGIYLGLNERDTLSLTQKNNHIVRLENGRERIIKANNEEEE